MAEVNSCPSLERNSFLFLQAARCGMTHEHVLTHIVSTARERARLEALPEAVPAVESTVLTPATRREVLCCTVLYSIAVIALRFGGGYCIGTCHLCCS